MSAPQFPEYGDSGDFIGARRMRRAFRWGVALIVVFTVLMWTAEQFRYSQPDNLYLSALTLLPQQGRNLLRQAVIIDDKSEQPSTKYREALAEREEPDLVIGVYERAYQMDPENPDLAIKFGCELFKTGQAGSARELFRKASEGGTHNALAVYLEAAMLPWSDANDPDIAGAFALVQQANDSPDRVTIPLPMWWPTLPREGFWYAQLRREMTRHCAMPLEKLAERLLEATERDLQDGNRESALARVDALAAMGRRIAESAVPPDNDRDRLSGGAAQAYLGLRTELLALRQRARLGGASSEEEKRRIAQLEQSLQTIENFERRRQEIVEAERRKYAYPLQLSAALAAVLLGMYFLAYLPSKLFGRQSAAHTVRPSRISQWLWLMYALGLFSLLLLISVLQRSTVGDLPGTSAITFFWWAIVGVAAGGGIIGPWLHLPRPEIVVARLPVELRSETKLIREKYRAAYLSLVKRHFGVVLGLGLSVVSVWVLVYRIVVGAFPWMIPLLATGLEAEELGTVRSVLQSLG